MDARRRQPWKPGAKLKLLFAGYNGTRNTGSDVRVEEMLRQVRRILGAENLALSVMSQNFDLTRGYFGDARQVHLPDIFPPFLHSEVRQQRRRGRLRRLDVQEQIRQCAHHHDHRRAGHRLGAKQTERRLRRRSRAHGSDAAENVRALLPRFAGHHAQRGIAGRFLASWACPPNSARTPRGRSSRSARNMAAKRCSMRAGTARRPCWRSARSIPFWWPVKPSL